MILNPLPQGSYRKVQGFGENPKVYERFGHKGHAGLDLAPLKPGTKGVVLRAPHYGYVIRGNDPKGYGLFVKLQSLPRQKNGEGLQSTLAHLEKFLVEDGQFVPMGDPIGIMGTTGFSTGIHVHWALKPTINGKVKDPGNGYGGAIDPSPFVRTWTDIPF